eukprot:TRINITY_DN26926_c0_g1_i2.p1 TRINITY_DN26926_c0_g1~~TRINITY_DN26926_c0_g1_i2.p1  ORF type:complete len:324 (+),score=111.18 TRINITY_DN26926_c0_g1_i2:84-974(+)
MQEGDAAPIPAWSRYRMVRPLGAGSFGQVYLVEAIPGGDGVPGEHVVKRIPVGDVPQHVVEGAANEVYVLTVLNHPNIVSYRDHFVDSESFLNIVTELCPCGDLAQRIERCRGAGVGFSSGEVVYITFQLLVAIRYLHSMEVMHRDLKPGNVFLMDQLGVKVGDFGISKMMSCQSVAQTMVGTPFYFSPEVSSGEPYTHPADLWSLGCVVYEVATLRRPFGGANILAIVRAINSGVYEPLPAGQERLAELLRRMLVVDPGARGTAEGLLREFFCLPLSGAAEAAAQERIRRAEAAR